MVFFTCNHCGESLKKQAVEKHGWRCKQNAINVSCMDCQKDFIGKEYDAHTSCISELEKYSGKDYVPKANANKGAKKQEAWINTIRSITNRKKDLSRGVSEVFNVIRNNDNIPRKQKGFLNFFQNSAKHIKLHDVQAAWSLLEEEVKTSNANNNGPQQNLNGTDPSKANGETNVPAVNGVNKRKLEDSNNGDIVTEQPAPKKKKKQRDLPSNDQAALLDASAAEGKTLEHEGAAEKFKWRDAIRTTLDAKGNEMKLSKLRKKVLKKYHQFVGSSVDAGDKIERKFSKTITKLGLVVDNETVRLIN
ncbi:cell growth-regulating nucleolar protein [Sabethes cyaneus]|uniref:cell growth-regulating nucleolar protein n=1 Tax=Sabethes cyaneus TaxID=53552 RepID=UPI00237DA781|nr:cell growth-regulating nucleolar protein [Sabethes cyaneus]